MSRRWPSRFPAEPAQRAIRSLGRRHALSLAEIADVLAVDPRLLRSVMGRRWLGWETADTIAVALRRHPLDLWPDWMGTRGRRPPVRDQDAASPCAG
jgi:hypothetical protein